MAKKLPIALACAVTCIVVTSFAGNAAADTLARQIVNAHLTSKGCADRIPKLKAIASNAPRGARADLNMSIAECYLELGNGAAAARHARKAVGLGFSDCFYLKNNKTIQKLNGIAAIKRRVRMSPADYHEMAWLFAESMKINHDTSMMITENMNRKDGDQTVVPVSTLPTRSTRNASILLARAVILVLQNHQRFMVRRSDNSRIKHLVNMNIINNMGGRSRYNPYAIAQSKCFALQRARARQRAIQMRAYKPSRASTRPVACTNF